MDPPKVLSQVVLSVTHVEFRLMLSSLQEAVVAQSMTWPEILLSVPMAICGDLIALHEPEFTQFAYAAWEFTTNRSVLNVAACQLMFGISKLMGVLPAMETDNGEGC